MKSYSQYLLLFLAALIVMTGCDDGSGQKNPASVGGVERNYDTPATQPKETPQPAGFVPEPGQQTELQFAHLGMTFGPIVSGDTVNAVYPFKNMSLQTVRIAQVVTSCECLKTEFTEGNIQPGQEGEIKAHFYTEGQWGTHEKIIAVQLEGQNEAMTLRLNGQVLKKE